MAIYNNKKTNSNCNPKCILANTTFAIRNNNNKISKHNNKYANAIVAHSINIYVQYVKYTNTPNMRFCRLSFVVVVVVVVFGAVAGSLPKMYSKRKRKERKEMGMEWNGGDSGCCCCCRAAGVDTDGHNAGQAVFGAEAGVGGKRNIHTTANCIIYSTKFSIQFGCKAFRFSISNSNSHSKDRCNSKLSAAAAATHTHTKTHTALGYICTCVCKLGAQCK